MKSNWKNKWIEALRSGDFKQGKSKLTSKFPVMGHYEEKEDFDCCLGVLCKIVGRDNGVIREDYSDGSVFYGFMDAYGNKDTNPTTLPMGLTKFVELEDSNPRIEYAWYGVPKWAPHLDPAWHNETTSLANLNDDGLTFDQIADMIERFL